MIDIQATLERALKEHQAGRLGEAQGLYQQVLTADPNQPDAMHLLGLIAHQQGRGEEAIELLRRAIAVKTDVAAFHVNLANMLTDRQDLHGAAAALETALRLEPGLPQVHNNRGNVLARLGKRPEGVACYRQAIQLMPNYADAYANLGSVLMDLGEADEAEASMRRAVELQPGASNFCTRLAGLLLRRRKYVQALEAAQRAVSVASQLPPQPAMQRSRALGAAYSSVGDVLSRMDRSQDALGAYRSAIEAMPDAAEARCSAAGLLRNEGRIAESIELSRQALLLRPNLAACHSNLLIALHSVAEIGPDELLREHVEWARIHASSRPGLAPHQNDRDPDRKLRIGYVSGDFREHSVTRFFLRVLEAHDKSQLHVTCYSTINDSDEITARVKAAADSWRDVSTMSDDDLAAMIRSDQIDILVDLAGHTRGNRLVIFATHKPAPVQVTWIGWIGTTGVKEMDYCITDEVADPPGEEVHHVEQLYRLKVPYFCYGPPDDSPPVADAPLTRNGYITFGSFNNPAKFSPQVIKAWARILSNVPDARLLIKAIQLADPQTRGSVHEMLVDHGLPPDRVTLIGPEARTVSHLAAYGMIDIALDTYPFGGITTTAEALWMGVPVVAWKGRTHVSRVSHSFLTAIGLGELAASNADEYIKMATGLAADRDRVVRLRAYIRDRVLNSNMTEAQAHSREMEAAYRAMWRRWCSSASAI